MDSLQETPDGILLPVKAIPGSSKNSVRGWHNGRLKVAVTAAPEKGKANQAIIKLLAKLLALTQSQLLISSGHTTQEKTFLVTEVTKSELESRLSSHI